MRRTATALAGRVFESALAWASYRCDIHHIPPQPISSAMRFDGRVLVVLGFVGVDPPCHSCQTSMTAEVAADGGGMILEHVVAVLLTNFTSKISKKIHNTYLALRCY